MNWRRAWSWALDMVAAVAIAFMLICATLAALWLMAWLLVITG